MSEVIRLTSVPKSIGPLYRLCKTCGGSGERIRPSSTPTIRAEKQADGSFARDRSLPAARRERDCQSCGGIGETLS